MMTFLIGAAVSAYILRMVTRKCLWSSLEEPLQIQLDDDVMMRVVMIVIMIMIRIMITMGMMMIMMMMTMMH